VTGGTAPTTIRPRQPTLTVLTAWPTAGPLTKASGPTRTMRSPSIGTVEENSSALFPAGRSGETPECTTSVGGLRMAQETDYAHQPVMADEVVALFGAVPPGIVVDATVGGGGHAARLLAAHPHLSLIGIDRDPEALAAAAVRLRPFGDRVVLRRARFDQLEAVVEGVLTSGRWAAARPQVTGVLFDLGVSSPQLDRPERGFSYRTDGPLDMRMDQGTGPSARDLVNEMPEHALAALFAANGEARFAHRIARAVIRARPITTTAALAEVVAGAIPAAARRRGHPARRVFQALRIAVNDELDQLETTLPAALGLLDAGGRAVVLSYHSGEDRITKSVFHDAVTGGCVCPPDLPCVCGASPRFRLVFRGSRQASAEEIQSNRRAESARLRAIECVVDAERDDDGSGEGADGPEPVAAA
jgi:16S rRNA (cytosine1402-N4)-methyltransferase